MKLTVCTGFVMLAVGMVRAQQGAIATSTLNEDLHREIRLLHLQLDSLKAASQNLANDREDGVDRLEDRLEKRLQELEAKIDAVSRASATTVLNPRTTAFINVAARADSKAVYDPADSSKEISNRPYLRSAEIELSNPVDPYADAVAVISIENAAGKEFSVDAEEAYGVIKQLPLIEAAPLGLKLKIGKFRAPFGVNNKIHLHDLPWTTRPLVVERFLGTEHGNFFESGFNPTGIDLNFFVPNPIPQSTLEANIDVVRAGELGLSTGQSGTQPGWLGHLNFSRDWSNEHLLVLGASGYAENGRLSTKLYGADLTYKWAPAEERESRSLVGGGEFFAGKHTGLSSSGSSVTISPYGWYGYLQYQTSYWLYLGLRYDWVKALPPSVAAGSGLAVARSLSAYASYYTTEFLRFRVGLEHRWGGSDLTTGILEVNFVFGSHPTEPYWVNK